MSGSHCFGVRHPVAGSPLLVAITLAATVIAATLAAATTATATAMVQRLQFAFGHLADIQHLAHKMQVLTRQWVVEVNSHMLFGNLCYLCIEHHGRTGDQCTDSRDYQ